MFFFFKQKTAYELGISDWSSDVCSSDLSLDLHQVDPRQLHTSLHLLAIDQDRLVPRADIQSLARVTGASFTCLSSEYGHDAFLKETEAVGDGLAACLRQDLRMRGLALGA